MSRHALIGVALLLVVSGCGGGGGSTEPSRRATSLVVLRGSEQSIQVGRPLGGPVVVMARDDRGGIGGVTVTFAVSSGGGSVGAATVVTNAAGEAALAWTLGTIAGTQTVTASAAGVSSITITATATPAPAAKLVPVEGVLQYAEVKKAVPIRPKVRVTDQYDNPVTGITVSFAITAGIGASISDATPVSDAAGYATLGDWILGPGAGRQAVAAIGAGQLIEFLAIGSPAVLVAVSPTDQSANAGTAARFVPVVEARDGDGQVLSNVEVTFSVVSGAGSVTVATSTTDLRGRANPQRWLLGGAAGLNQVEAKAQGPVAAVTFRATGVEPAPISIVPIRGAVQQGFVDNFTGQLPAVRVTDAAGNPVAGRQVTFELLGSGTLIAGTGLLDQDGVASVESWRLPSSAGTSTVRATVAGLPPVTFTTTVTDPPATGFHIELAFISSPTPTQRAAFEAAAAKWSSLIVGDLPDVPVLFGDDPAGCHSGLNITVDDVIVLIAIEDIDGVGGILGAAGPCLARDVGFFPVLGRMELDQADLTSLEASGRLTDVITHELGHVLGFGSLLWQLKGLMTGALTSNPLFTGPSARAAYTALARTGSPFSAGRVPLENTGGQGTRDSHWRETVLDTELMTGFINQGTNPLSQITAAAMRDLGYLVDDRQTNPFSFLAAVRAAAAPATPIPHTLPWTAPIGIVDRDGRIIRRLR